MNEELKAMLESVLNEALQPIKEDLQALKGDFQTLKGDFQTLKAGQSELQQFGHAISDPQEENNLRLEALTMDVHRLTRDIASLKQTQARQEEILETLALRSLEHETDIRILKQAKK